MPGRGVQHCRELSKFIGIQVEENLVKYSCLRGSADSFGYRFTAVDRSWIRNRYFRNAPSSSLPWTRTTRPLPTMDFLKCPPVTGRSTHKASARWIDSGVPSSCQSIHLDRPTLMVRRSETSVPRKRVLASGGLLEVHLGAFQKAVVDLTFERMLSFADKDCTSATGQQGTQALPNEGGVGRQVVIRNGHSAELDIQQVLALNVLGIPRGGAILTLQSGATPAFAAKGDFFLQRTAPATHQPLTHHRSQARKQGCIPLFIWICSYSICITCAIAYATQYTTCGSFV